MSWLSSFMHPGKGYDKAQDQLNKGYDESKGLYNDAQGYQQPYNQHGQDQYTNLQSYIDNLMHPEKLQDEWSKGYKESESAKNAEGMAQEHGLDAASSMGLMGSSPALGAIQAGTTQIGLDERQKYLDDLMQKYMGGAGIVQGIYGTGASAAGQMGQNAMTQGQNAINHGKSSAEMAYGKENAGGNMFGNLLGTAVGALSGPIGSALGKHWNL